MLPAIKYVSLIAIVYLGLPSTGLLVKLILVPKSVLKKSPVEVHKVA
jgi:hypothetical protein